MRNLSNYSLNESDPSNQVTEPGAQYAIERANSSLAHQPESGDHRTALYARLRTIIDSATESIRNLKDENAALAQEKAELSQEKVELSNRIGTLEYRIRAVTADLANDELALRRSAEVLEQVLRTAPTAPFSSANARVPAGAPDAPPAINAMPPGAAEPEAAMPVMEQAMTEADAPVAEPGSPAPPASMADQGTNTHVTQPITLGNTDSMYTLIAYPFVRFSDLGQFQSALQKLSGVHDVQVRRFAQGTLEMRIGYAGTTDLATVLRTLAAEIEDVEEEEPYRLRVRLRASQSG